MIKTATGQEFRNREEMFAYRKGLVNAKAAAMATYDAMIENITLEIEQAGADKPTTLRVVS